MRQVFFLISDNLTSQVRSVLGAVSSQVGVSPTQSTGPFSPLCFSQAG